MRVFVSVDIEGVTGLVSWSQCGGPNSSHYDWVYARRMMTHDANAAIRGARSGGATHIVLKDSHGSSRNLLIDELEPGVELISGTGPHPGGMMTGIDSTFDCAMLVGYHGRAGTQDGVMEHTISGSIHRMWINGQESGELAMSIATAGTFGVPLVMVSSDDKGCAEAASLVPGIKTAQTKIGMGRYIARLAHPDQTRVLIESAAQQGVQSAPDIKPWRPSEPVHIKIEHNQSEQCDYSSLIPGWTRVDAYAYEGKFPTWAEAHRATRVAMAYSSLSSQASK